MTQLDLDPARIRELFDLRRNERAGGYEEDPYPLWHRLRETGPLHEGTPGPLLGFEYDVPLPMCLEHFDLDADDDVDLADFAALQRMATGD